MIKIILTTVIGVSLLGGLSFFLVWYGEYSKKGATRRYNKKFHYFDKYFSEMETASEKQMEKRRQDRISIFKQDQAVGGPNSVSGLQEKISA